MNLEEIKEGDKLYLYGNPVIVDTVDRDRMLVTLKSHTWRAKFTMELIRGLISDDKLI